MMNNDLNSELKVLVSGTGYFSQFHYEAWQRCESTTLVGVCNRSPDKADEFASRYDIAHSGSDLIALIDASHPHVLDIVTPPTTHLESIRIAADKKVNVICQKPFCENIEQASEAVRVAEAAGITLIIHENFRFMPWYRKVKSVVDGGALGEILNAQFNLRPGDGQGDRAYLDRQPYFQKMEKFVVHETAVHLVDTFRFLFGDVRSVYSHLRRCNPAIAGEDSAHIVLEMSAGVQAVIDANRLLDHSASNTRRTMGELLIEGTHAVLRLDGEGRIWLREFAVAQEQQLEYTWVDQNFGGDCVYLTIEHIAQHFLNSGPIENTGKEYLENIKIENAIYESSASKQCVVLT